MTPPRPRPLRDVLAMHRDEWDRDETRPAVRDAFAKVVDCGTETLGAEVFASESEERVVYHTCKSRACPSCGYQATRAWQRDQWRELPDVPYAHVCLTMPDLLWPLFQRNRHLLHDLPVLGAQVLQQWARQKYSIRLMIVVIPHTFGRHLNFNCHLHILVSEGGLREDGTRWHARARLDRTALMPMWRYAVITLLREAARAGVLDTDMDRRALRRLLTAQYERWWNIDIQRFRSKKQFLGYAGRYARRPPIAQHRFRAISRQEIRFVTKDTRTKRTVETACTPAEFLATLADHVPDRYRVAGMPFLRGWAVTTESAPWALRVGLTVISTSCPSAARNSISRPTENVPERLRISSETCGCWIPRTSPAWVWVRPRCLMIVWICSVS